MLAESSYCGNAVYLRSKNFLFIMGLLLLVILSRNATSSAGPGTRQSTTDSTQRVDHQLKAYIYMLPVVRESIVHDDMKV